MRRFDLDSASLSQPLITTVASALVITHIFQDKISSKLIHNGGALLFPKPQRGGMFKVPWHPHPILLFSGGGGLPRGHFNGASRRPAEKQKGKEKEAGPTFKHGTPLGLGGQDQN
jgi:hypothetical protein